MRSVFFGFFLTLSSIPAVTNPFAQRGSDLIEDKWISLSKRGEHARRRTDIANLDYFGARSLGGRSPQNHWSGDSGCAEELDHIATAPQFASRIRRSHCLATYIRPQAWKLGI